MLELLDRAKFDCYNTIQYNINFIVNSPWGLSETNINNTDNQKILKNFQETIIKKLFTYEIYDITIWFKMIKKYSKIINKLLRNYFHKKFMTSKIDWKEGFQFTFEKIRDSLNLKWGFKAFHNVTVL